MPKKRLWILLMILAIFALLLSGCRKTSEPPIKPVNFSVIDMPNDDGSRALAQWDHYAASSNLRYVIRRGESRDAIDQQIAEISAQVAVPAVDTAKVNDFEQKDYYLVLDKSQNPPVAQIVEATGENADSIKAIGEKVSRVELAIAPNDGLPLTYATGEFMRVNPPEKLLNEPVFRTVDNVAIDGDSIVPGNQSLSLKLEISEREREFIKKGRQILSVDSPNGDLARKHGKLVKAVVTDKGRYALNLTTMNSVDADAENPVQPGKTYYYQCEVFNRGGQSEKSDVVEVTIVDDAPNPVQNSMVLADSTNNNIVVKWQAVDSDLKEIKIYETTLDDTLMEKGKIIVSVHPSWENYQYKTDGTLSEKAWYIEAVDAGNSTKTPELLTSVPASFEEPSIPEGLHIADYENDEALGLAYRWGPPSITFNAVATAISKEKTENTFPENYYFYNNEITEFTDSIPEDALKIHGYYTEVASKEVNLKVGYELQATKVDEPGFASIKLVGNGIDEEYHDRDGLGFALFENLKPGEYTLTATMYNENGFKYDNKESVAEMTFELTGEQIISNAEMPSLYKIFRTPVEENSPEKNQYAHLTTLTSQYREYNDRWRKDDDGNYRAETAKKYSYFMRVFGPNGNYIDSETTEPMKPKNNWFNTQLIVLFLFTLHFIVVVGYYMIQAKRGKTYYIRPIAGLTHIDEALGRATEMGKPILQVMGLGTISDLPTLASMTILGRVAKKAAEYQNRLIVPHCDPITMLVAQETVRSSYLDAGRPDAYNENDIFYITRSQFSYAAAVSGIMVREKTATNFFLGWFAAESLILAEAGAMTGAIQIAGTDAVSQLPFFITACDYTLIGEELYAASAYLSNDPLQMSSLRTQDNLKLTYMVLMVLGAIATSANILWFKNLFNITLER